MAESTAADLDRNEILRLSVDIVTAYVSKNPIPQAQITDVIQTVYSALDGLGGPAEEEVEPQKPAVPVKRSINPDYLICLEDGKKLKMLKRHLRTNYNMTPEEYRAKWGLSPDYPMVAPNYAKQRSEFAKKIGLGQKPQQGGRKGRGSRASG